MSIWLSARGSCAEIPRLVAEVRRTREQQVAVSSGASRGEPRSTSPAASRAYDPLREPEMRPSPCQAYVRIMIGCDKFCTYCVVPSVRGPEQSRPAAGRSWPRSRQLADEGCREITLLGQTVNSYQLHSRRSAASGAERSARTICMTRRGSSGSSSSPTIPKDMTDDLLEAVRDLPKVARYLHVPASGRLRRRAATHETRLHCRRVSGDAWAASAR